MVGRFGHEIVLPGSVDDKTLDAHLEKGVLTIRIPKAPAERPKQVSIK